MNDNALQLWIFHWIDGDPKFMHIDLKWHWMLHDAKGTELAACQESFGSKEDAEAHAMTMPWDFSKIQIVHKGIYNPDDPDEHKPC